MVLLKVLYLLIKQVSGEIFKKFILPILLIIIAFTYSKFWGWLFIVAFIGYLIYLGRVNIYAMLGNISYSKREMEKAIRWFGRAYEIGGLNSVTGISYAYLLLKSGNVLEAEKLLQDISDNSKSNETKMLAMSNLALAKWKKGELTEAIAILEEVFETYKNTTIYGSLGYLLILSGDLEKALQFNHDAYEYNNTNTIITDNLGQTYFLMGEYDKAQEIFEKLMEQSPTFAEAYYNYGCLLFKQGKADEALDMMERAKGYPLTNLSGITSEEIEDKIREIKANQGDGSIT